MAVSRFLMTLTVAIIFMVGHCSAMEFSQPVYMGGIGFHIGGQEHGYLVDDASYNDGTIYKETNKFAAKFSYIKGTAGWGNGEDALYCIYDSQATENNRFKFGGKNNCTINIDGPYKHIYKISTNVGITLYMLNWASGISHYDIIGRQKDGKWVKYIDTNQISKTYFGGKEAYKLRGGVAYDKPQFEGDTIILNYKTYTEYDGKIINQGEMRFKWDDAAQWFSVEQIKY